MSFTGVPARKLFRSKSRMYKKMKTKIREQKRVLYQKELKKLRSQNNAQALTKFINNREQFLKPTAIELDKMKEAVVNMDPIIRKAMTLRTDSGQHGRIKNCEIQRSEG